MNDNPYSHSENFSDGISRGYTLIGNGVAVVDNSTLRDFDFMVVRYRWQPSDGKDLDTRTFIQVPNRVKGLVGWGFGHRDDDYLIWNGDNRTNGVESVLIDMKKLINDNPQEVIFLVALRAFWYATKYTGNVTVEFDSYKGGVMEALGYDWVNRGGSIIESLTLDTNTDYANDSNKRETERGLHLATLQYNVADKTGTIVRSTDFSGSASLGQVSRDRDGFVTIPELGLSRVGYNKEPFVFTAEIDKSELDIVIIKTNGCIWELRENGILIASNNQPLDNGTIVNPSNTYIKLVDRGVGVKTYTLDSDGGETCRLYSITVTTPINILKFDGYFSNYEFEIHNASLTVPSTLPPCVTNMRWMFQDCHLFNQDISMWDVSNVINMAQTFANCFNFNQDLSQWDTSQVKNMNYMFLNCTSFNQPLDSWSVLKVSYMEGMFSGATSFNQDLSSWWTSLFYLPTDFDTGATSWVKSRPIWGTKIRPIGDDTSITDNPLIIRTDPSGIPLYIGIVGMTSKWELYEDDILIASEDSPNGLIPSDEGSNRELGEFVITLPTNRYGVRTYRLHSNGTLCKISGWGGGAYPKPLDIIAFSEVYTNYNISVEATLTVPTTLPRSVTSMSGMFRDCVTFNQDISMWDVSNITVMRYAFSGCYLFNQPLNNWNVSNVTDMLVMFSSADSFNQDLSSWNTSKVTNMRGMFSGCSKFNQDISMWDTSNVVNMTQMFESCDNFNKPLNSWNVSNVIDMSEMFNRAESFNQGLSNWDVSSVKNMKEMFRNCTSFNGSLSGWDTKIVKDMSYMFDKCTSFNQPLNSWHVGGVTNMRNMFKDCANFNQPLENWDTRNVSNMSYMFEYCANFNQDLSSWCVPLLSSLPSRFDRGATSWILPKPIWGTCPHVQIIV